ncbi:MAG: DUF2156 domain-containing protein, partial [Anaerolineae bacterium]
MTTYPTFPDFKPLTLEDRDIVHQRLWQYQPETSELTFINLYIWREYYDFQWSVAGDYLLIVANRAEETFALQPIGPAPRDAIVRDLLHWLRDTRGVAAPSIRRADHRLVDELQGCAEFVIEPVRAHFDYVYRSEDLGSLAGRKYSKKRNHINQFLRAYTYTYVPITPSLTDDCLALAEVWCEQRLCEDDISLLHEFCGIRDALDNFAALQLEGGTILIDEKVQAFSLGELLNETTAVVHIEKANPEFKGIYPMITKQFSEQRWQGQVEYINREQDLDDPGLRHAKESYYPDHLV